MRMERHMSFNSEYKNRTEYVESVLKKYLPEKEGLQKVIMEAMEYSLMAEANVCARFLCWNPTAFSAGKA